MEGKVCDTPFLSQLGEFCSNLDKRVSYLKLVCNEKAGSNPQHYDKGLSIFKSELSELKVLAENTKSKIGEIQQFAHFTESLQDLVSQQAADIKHMENYLKKFGYVVPEDEKFGSNEASIKENGYLMEDKINCIKFNEGEFSTNNPNLMTPELSEIGKCILQGKTLPILESLAKKNDNYYTSSTTTPTRSQTPAKSPSQSGYEATPINSSVKNINNWLLNVHAEASFAITPNVICEKPRNSLRETNFSKQLRYPSPLKEKVNLENRIPLIRRKGSSMSKTPEEPTLSHLGSFMAANDRSSKEQNLGSQLKSSVLERHTPEEPVLSFTRNLSTYNKDNSTPEEPTLSFARNPSTYNDNTGTTPEEPVLNFSRNLHTKFDNTPEEPVLSTDFNASPRTPQLSDVTQKLLNTRNLRFRDSDSTGSIPLNKFSPINAKENRPLLLIPSKLPENILQSPELSDVTLRILNKQL